MKKLQLIARRLLQMIPVLIGISLITFVLAQASPGDPIRLLLGARASEEVIAAVRARYGLDEPVLVQYFYYLRNLAQGDWGRSIVYRMPVLELIASRFAPTLYLVAGGLLFSVVPTLVLAVLVARRPDGWLDQITRLGYTVGLGLPSYWLGLVLSLLFAVQRGWFPATGFGDTPREHIHHLILPSLTVGLAMMPILLRNLRATLLEKQEADFVTAGRAKGLPEGYIFGRHVFPNSLLPALHLLGVVAVYILGISVIVEPLFALPGLGQLFIRAILGRDYFVVQALTLIFAVFSLLATLVVDVASMVLDPRIET